MKIRNGEIPTGKGDYIYVIERLVKWYGSLEKFVDAYYAAGFEWMFIKIFNGYVEGTGGGKYDTNSEGKSIQMVLLDALMPLLYAKGIKAHAWGYCFGNTTPYRKWKKQDHLESDLAVNILRRYAERGTPFLSFTVNGEKELKNGGGAVAPAYSLMSRVTTKLKSDPLIDVPVGFSSFRFPSLHNLPWETILEFCDFGQPQIYWQGSDNVEEQTIKSIQEWIEIKDIPQVVAGTTYTHDGVWWPTPEHQQEFIDTLKIYTYDQVPAVCWWEHYYTLLQPGNYEIISSFEYGEKAEIPDPEPDPEPDTATKQEWFDTGNKAAWSEMERIAQGHLE